jgi:hypothetical protein
MTMTDMTPKEQLNLAFDEIDKAKTNLDTKRGDLQLAQQQADEADGLTGAAQRQQENAQAKLRVLELAEADYKSLQAKQAELVTDLATARKERDQAQTAYEASTAITNAVRDMSKWTGTAEKAGQLFAGSAEELRKLPVTDDAKKALATTVTNLEGQQASLDKQLDELKTPQGKLSDAEQKFKALALTGPQRAAQRRVVERLERRLDAVKQEEKDETGVDPAEVNQARSDYVAAKRAVLEAPEVERSRRIELQSARAELADAEDRYHSARADRDDAEQLYIEDIDLAGPGADGVVIAKAQLQQDLPEDYSLQWTVDGVPATAEQDGTLHINTKGLAPRDYEIEVHLGRASKTVKTAQAGGS